MTIEHISDTARWVAVYRAMETERPDAHFHDPYARRLAGAHGEEIVNSLRHGKSAAWAMIVRTAVLDELILTAIRERGVDLVLNLAAGLDARPYRMPLQPSLRWVEVDLPGILEYKREQLAGASPTCRLESVALDLTNRSGRQELFDRLGREARCVLIVTEGLLAYLTPEEVASLATDLHTPPSFTCWLSDIASPRLLRMLQRMYGKQLKAGQAQMQFGPAEGGEFFRPYGWRLVQFRSALLEAHRLRREMRLAWLFRLFAITKRQQAEWKNMSGMIELERT